MNRRKLATVGAITLCVAAVVFAWRWWRDRDTLPYRDSFAKNEAAEWVAYGGQWQIRSGTVVNRSNEDGAKLVTGSRAWRDYELDADLKLIGREGNVGVIARVSDEEMGTDSYNGYYVGLRSGDSAFVVGRADHGWLGGRPTLMRGGVRAGVWYRLRVLVVGCRLAAEATNLTTGETSDLSFEEQGCPARGRIGLRSIGVGGAWKSVQVIPAGEAQWRAIASRAAFTTHPMYPIREDDYNHMLEALQQQGLKSGIAPVPRNEPMPVGKVTSIASAKASATSTEEVVFRGVVTLTSPLYIQDETGGVEVRAPHAPELNLGDEVQVEGAIMPDGASAYLQANSLRVLGERTPVSPIAVTSSQAADGSFDGRLVQLSGTLRAKSTDGDAITLRLADAEETFLAVEHGVLSPGPVDAWTPGSQLRVRGICRVGHGKEQSGAAFTILVRATDDVDVLRGPPWWAPHLIARYILVLLGLVGLSVYLYVRAERDKMRAILGERERLAHEMHDTLAQSFAGVGFHLQGVRNSLRTGSLALPAVLEKLDVACRMVTRTHREASAEIAALHPGTSDGADLLTALERSTHAMVDESLPAMKLVREGTARGVSPAVRDAFFQVGRESIANILRHSSATEIVLRLRYEPRSLELEVSDNGCGFRYDERAEDFGIRGMRRRMERVHGSLRIESEPGRGTRVAARASYGTARFTGRLRKRRV